jgi:release factor glutamine methyltransferase
VTSHRFAGLRLVVPRGVYAPRSDTALLAEALPDVTGAEVLELCSGSGALALAVAARGATRVLAVDRSARAVVAARVNARLNRLGQVEVRRGDLLEALRPQERFDLILANPPYLPAEVDDDPRWDAGADGRALLDRIVAGAPARLRPGGRLALVQSGFAGVEKTVSVLEHAGLTVAAPVERRGPLGPIGQARRAHLERRGVLAPGANEELMAVVVATRPAAGQSAVAA